MSSTETAYSSESSPTHKDFAKPTSHQGKYGAGPSLQDPKDPIQNSDQAYEDHLSKTQRTVGPGPTTQKPSNQPEIEQHQRALWTQTNGSHRTSVETQRDETIATLRNKIGLEPEPPIMDGHEIHHNLVWSTVRTTLREPFAEFFGTFIMVLFGDGSVAQVLLSGGQSTAPGKDGFGNYQSINWGWGIGVMLGIYVAGDSGGFLNPAVTLSFCIFRKFPWRRWPIYLIAQFLGGFCAAGVVYANYLNGINEVEGHGIRTTPPSTTATAGIFCTYPQAFLTKASQFFSEFIASTILMFVIFALKDDSNPGAMGKSGAGKLFPIALLFLIFAIGACFGWETGYAINLARDFGPRLMSYIVGYGPGVWTAGDYYFWVPIVAPFCGCVFGGFLYDLFVYTGPESPVNTPWLGFKYLISGGYWRKKKDQEKYDV